MLLLVVLWLLLWLLVLAFGVEVRVVNRTPLTRMCCPVSSRFLVQRPRI